MTNKARDTFTADNKASSWEEAHRVNRHVELPVAAAGCPFCLRAQIAARRTPAQIAQAMLDEASECGAKFIHDGRTATTYFYCNKPAGHESELHVAPDGKGGTIAW